MPDQPARPAGDPRWGLCATCTHAVVITSDKGSAFVQCARAKNDPRYRRYPVVPVLRCEGYETSSPRTA